MPFELEPLPALRDNYIWLLANRGGAVVVDPGDVVPVQRVLSARNSTLAAILLTHHHADHTGGALELARHYGCPVYGPANEPIAAVNRPLQEGQYAEIPDLGLRFRVLDIPGHTAGHIAFYSHNIVFCGDTLFSAGCGRLFEGSPEQMSGALDKLASLPGTTAICCGHEYTLDNLKFAAAVEPANREILEYAEQAAEKRRQGLPTLPSTLERERQINPFLRCREPPVTEAAERHAGHELQDTVEVFAAIRAWKDNFS